MCKWNNGGVVVKSPDWLKAEGRESVCIDECITGTIQALWNAGVVTLGCCCGHDRSPCTVIIESSLNPAMLATAYRVLELFDDRRWSIQEWKLVEVAIKPQQDGNRDPDSGEDQDAI